MDYKNFLESLRTKREFKQEEVTYEILEKAVECATYAASAKNSQVLRYALVKEKDLCDEIYAETGLNLKYKIPFDKSPMAYIVMGAIENDLTDFILGMDTGIAAQIIRESLALDGVASVDVNMFNKEKVQESLNFNDFKPIHLIALGYSDQEIKVFNGDHEPRNFQDEEGNYNVSKLKLEDVVVIRK